mgnify:CR=1 FL=1
MAIGSVASRDSVPPHGAMRYAGMPTALTNILPEETKNASLAGIPMGRWGDPLEVADAVVFLAGETAGYITGQVLNVDGGMVMG